ncbi:glycosyltransferase family 1 protein [Robertmurraya sp. GLU-23]
MTQIRVLHILDGLKSGGAESFIMNVYREINRDNIQFDFLIRTSEDNIYIDEIRKLGGRVYYLPSFPKEFFKNLKALNSFFKEHTEYRTIHVHANSLIYIFPLIFAKNHGIKNRIIHSHNTHASTKLASILHYIFRPYANEIATQKLACSKLAGKWMYANRQFEVINNAIETKKFRFDKNIRQTVRNELKVDNKLVIGHIGRFVAQKNHKFLLEIFKGMHEANKDTILVLVGDGPLQKEIKEEIARYDLQDAVYLLGVRTDIPKLLQAFDLFLFPSLFEGLPFTLIEAQAAGVPCVISESITNEVVLINNVKKLPLSLNAKEWAIESVDMLKDSKHYDTFDEISNSGFDIHNTVRELEKIYYGEY